MTLSWQSKFMICGGAIAALTALWHLLCIIGGPSWYAFARAPQHIIESAEQGTYVAPLGAVIIAGLMFYCTAFAFSTAGLIRKTPLIPATLITPALITIALLCITRALIAIPFLVRPTGVDVWEVVASSVWLFVGICYLFGVIEQIMRRNGAQN